ncbi:phage tail protein [Actinoalloteichus hymeniacidonis]|uniref:Phage tail protein n=1 Tax=Actinoalloteichus hymeniacidonis TaxID=340345 RepID=A0AAC9MZU2_9PSEU|nr:phage tail protein [Actinoalloteichus hymeniacidonis]AOS64291.1 phage tail protein [Actinoalloteichus hymeniacidonis]MBB5907641.1 phage tail-like protein [Actinoalloteichus hymeniacidonis]
MTRGPAPGLLSRHRMGEQLPSMYADDSLAQRLTQGLDEVLAPVLGVLDNLPAYFDPALAPPDFLEWLASWLAVEIEPDWPEPLRRAVVARAVALHGSRGTRRGLTERLWLLLGVRAAIIDGGGAAWSTTPGAALPGTGGRHVLIRVWRPDGGPVPVQRVRSMVESVRPAHLVCTVEVVSPPVEDPHRETASAGPPEGEAIRDAGGTPPGEPMSGASNEE